MAGKETLNNKETKNTAPVKRGTPRMPSTNKARKNKKPAMTSEQEHLYHQSKNHWLLGEWRFLTELGESCISAHPERAHLALLIASAYQQLDDQEQGEHWTKKALLWGASKRTAAQVLISGVHNTLARIAALREDEDKMKAHFSAAINIAETQDVELMVHARSVKEMGRLGLLKNALMVIENALPQQKLFSSKQTLQTLQQMQINLRAAQQSLDTQSTSVRINAQILAERENLWGGDSPVPAGRRYPGSIGSTITG